MIVPSPLTEDLELVPPPGIDKDHFEVIDGRFVEMPPMSIYASQIASDLHTALNHFVRTQRRGRAVVEGLFRLPLPRDRIRKPDVAFVSFERWPESRPMPEVAAAWTICPDLIVEVISPTDLAEDTLEKIEEYFEAGARLVWIVYPRRRIVHVYESPTRLNGLTRADTLDGGTVLPGLQIRLDEIFPAPVAEANGAV